MAKKYYVDEFGIICSKKEDNMERNVNIDIPMGSWDIETGVWYPNRLLESHAKYFENPELLRDTRLEKNYKPSKPLNIVFE